MYIEKAIYFVIIIVFAVPIGMACKYFSIWLDECFEYGQIFWKYRRWVIRLRVKNKAEFDQSLEHAISTDEESRQENITSAYNHYKVFWSSWVLCYKCISTRVLLIVCALSILIIGMPIYIYPVFLFISFIGLKL